KDRAPKYVRTRFGTMVFHFTDLTHGRLELSYQDADNTFYPSVVVVDFTYTLQDNSGVISCTFNGQTYDFNYTVSDSGIQFDQVDFLGYIFDEATPGEGVTVERTEYCAENTSISNPLLSTSWTIDTSWHTEMFFGFDSLIVHSALDIVCTDNDNSCSFAFGYQVPIVGMQRFDFPATYDYFNMPYVNKTCGTVTLGQGTGIAAAVNMLFQKIQYVKISDNQMIVAVFINQSAVSGLGQMAAMFADILSHDVIYIPLKRKITQIDSPLRAR
ncbi:MAG: hypothetical protein KBT04_08015, partial [Bacteroidales bacterium]|nr:hypothetical protein [Candidatus Colimorpha onthohippi]